MKTKRREAFMGRKRKKIETAKKKKKEGRRRIVRIFYKEQKGNKFV